MWPIADPDARGRSSPREIPREGNAVDVQSGWARGPRPTSCFPLPLDACCSVGVARLGSVCSPRYPEGYRRTDARDHVRLSPDGLSWCDDVSIVTLRTSYGQLKYSG